MSNSEFQINTAATGEHGYSLTNTVLCKFDRYEIEVEVTPDGKFLGVSSIKTSKDFITQASRFASAQYHDVNAYYEGDPEE